MSQDRHPILAESQELRERFQTALMATVSAEAEPEASYTPYLLLDGNFYIFVSGLSAHTANLRHNGRVSLLFIEEESQANLFARKRLTYQCSARPIARDDERWPVLLDQYQELFGATVGMLRQLPDFILFELEPRRGNFVKGFGQAYLLEGDGLRDVRQATGK